MTNASLTIEQALQQAIAHHCAGELPQAEQLYRAILQAQPNHADANHNLGVLAMAVGKTSAALPFFKLALETNANHAQFWLSYIDALIQENQLDTARSILKQGQERGLQGEKVAELAARLVEPKPVKPANRPVSKAGGKKPKKAATANKVDINQLLALFNQGNHLKTEKSAREFIRRFPHHAFGWKILGAVLQNLGRLDDSLNAKIKSVALSPQDAEAQNNLGVALKKQNRLSEAEAFYRAAIVIQPDFIEAHNNLGNLLKEQNRLSEAKESYLAALAINPDFVEAHSNMGELFKDAGRLDEAEKSYRTALMLQPDYVVAYSNLLFTYTYNIARTAEFYLAEAKNYGEKVAQKVSQKFTAWQCEPQPTRLRVGLVSGDFWNHPVGYFLENLLAHLDSAKFELIAYPTIHRNDALTQRIQPYFSQWKSLVDLSDVAAARLIQADALHILLDLSGHTAKNRLPVFAWKPAPIQISWLGYWATTGVAEMDYILVDEIGVPEKNQWHFSEKVRYLPDTRLCFSAPKMNIAVSTLPALSKGYVTLGCFQNLTKVTDAVLAVWGQIFARLPTARLRLQSKQLSDKVFTEHFFARLKAVGIMANCVDIQGFTDREAYFAAHAEVDFILDSFPFTGGTTTCEALWMGVPTLTLAGETLVARQGASLLSAAGLLEWIVENEPDYIKQAVDFANNLDYLAQLRSRLRQQVLASPLFDGQRFARHFENILWQLWREI